MRVAIFFERATFANKTAFRRLQELAFACGWKWSAGQTEVLYENDFPRSLIFDTDRKAMSTLSHTDYNHFLYVKQPQLEKIIRWSISGEGIERFLSDYDPKNPKKTVAKNVVAGKKKFNAHFIQGMLR